MLFGVLALIAASAGWYALSPSSERVRVRARDPPLLTRSRQQDEPPPRRSDREQALEAENERLKATLATFKARIRTFEANNAGTGRSKRKKSKKKRAKRKKPAAETAGAFDRLPLSDEAQDEVDERADRGIGGDEAVDDDEDGGAAAALPPSPPPSPSRSDRDRGGRPEGDGDRTVVPTVDRVDRASLPALVDGVMILDVVVVPRQPPRPGGSCVPLAPSVARADAEAARASARAAGSGGYDTRRTDVHGLQQCDPAARHRFAEHFSRI